MNSATRNATTIICIVCFGIFCWFIYYWISGNLSQKLGNAHINKNPNAPELYYLQGCNHESFLNVYQNPFKTDEQTHADWIREGRLAQKDFSKAIDLAPDFASAYAHRARCKCRYGQELIIDYTGAIKDYQKAIDLVPYDGQLHNELARVYAITGKPLLAIEEYKKALELQGRDIISDCSIHLELARAYRAAGDIRTATEKYNKVLSVQPMNKAAQRELADLEKKNPK